MDAAVFPAAVLEAVERGDEQAVERWLDGGTGRANAREEVTGLGLTLLMAAAFYDGGGWKPGGRERLVASLLWRRADPNLQQAHGATALMMAAAEGRVETAKLLLQGGADAGLVEHEFGYTALELAEMDDQAAVAELLREHGAAGGESGLQASTLYSLVAMFG